MPSYRCEACRTTYPAGREGVDAVRRRHRVDFHGGGIPDEQIVADEGRRPISGWQVLVFLAVLVAVSVVGRILAFLHLL